MSEPEKKGLNTTQKILIAGIGIVLIAVLAIGGILVVKMGNGGAAVPEETAPASGSVVIDDTNAEDEVAKLKKKAQEGTFDCKMNMVWTFPDGKSPSSDAYVANSASNHGVITFDLRLQGSDEVIFTSPKIELGKALTQFKLDKELEAGEYSGVVTYHIFNAEEEMVGEVDFIIKLVVQA